MTNPMNDNSMEVRYYSTWTCREIETVRETVHAEILEVLISGGNAAQRAQRLAQLKRQRASLEAALEAKWAEGITR